VKRNRQGAKIRQGRQGFYWFKTTIISVHSVIQNNKTFVIFVIFVPSWFKP